jgi:hypothetical protein
MRSSSGTSTPQMTWWPELLAAEPVETHASWPSYLVAIGLTIGLLAIVWFNLRARARIRRKTEERRESEPQE